MNDRVAVVAGAGGEVGRAVAVALHASGHKVVGVDRSAAGLDELPDGVAREVADPTQQAGAKSVIDRIADSVGAPEVLVNVIGTFAMGDALQTTPDQLQLMVDVNLGAALWLSQSVAPYMQERGSGTIVHVTARPGLDPTAGMAAYSASKAALAQLVRLLDVELRPSGIRVNAVAPALIDTVRNRGFVPDDVMAHAVSPKAIADVIAFLASDSAAPVSGAILPAYGN